MTIQDEHTIFLLQIYELYSLRMSGEISNLEDFENQVQEVLRMNSSLPLVRYFNSEFPSWDHRSIMISFLLSTMVRGDDGKFNLALIDETSLECLINDNICNSEVEGQVSQILDSLSFSDKIVLTVEGWRLSPLEKENFGKIISGKALRRYIIPKSN